MRHALGRWIFCIGMSLFAISPTQSAPDPPAKRPQAPNPTVTSFAPEELVDFAKNPLAVRRLLTAALALTKQNLRYEMGSADPEKGGMDCSGTIYFVLRQAGVSAVPRQSNEQYRWVWEAGVFRAFNGQTEKSFELSALKPGDLLFWTGTYDTGKRDPAVSHVMIYLGETKSDGRPVMFGASDGRLFRGVPQMGVSVFDFRLPKEGSKSRFIGYAPVPGLTP